MKDKKKSGSGGGKKDDTSPKFQVRRICIFKPLPQASDTVRDMRKGKHLQVEIVDLLYSYPFLLYSSFPLMFVFVEFLFIPNITVSLIHQFQIILIHVCNAIVTNCSCNFFLYILAHNSSNIFVCLIFQVRGDNDDDDEYELGDMPVADELGPCTLAVATEETKQLSTPKPSKEGFSEILVHYLEKSAKETREVEQKVNTSLYSCNLKHCLILILHYKIQTCIFVFQIN